LATGPLRLQLVALWTAAYNGFVLWTHTLVSSGRCCVAAHTGCAAAAHACPDAPTTRGRVCAPLPRTYCTHRIRVLNVLPTTVLPIIACVTRLPVVVCTYYGITIGVFHRFSNARLPFSSVWTVTTHTVPNLLPTPYADCTTPITCFQFTGYIAVAYRAFCPPHRYLPTVDCAS